MHFLPLEPRGLRLARQNQTEVILRLSRTHVNAKLSMAKLTDPRCYNPSTGSSSDEATLAVSDSCFDLPDTCSIHPSVEPEICDA
jgi:hypothetical protein